jgi:aspartate/methionine/tyrosine aminotransferase
MKFNSYLTSKNEYSLGKYHALANELRSQGHDVINLTIGDPTERTFEGAYQALKDSIAPRKNSHYPAFKGSSSYKKSVANWAKRNHNLDLDPDTELCSCNGSKEAVFHLPLMFDWSDGAEIFAPSLSYPVYASSAKMMGITYRALPVSTETHFLPDLDLLTEADWQKCRVFWINSPHNPTSAIASRDYLAHLLELAEKHDFLVCSDECYNDIAFTDGITSILDFPESQNWLCFRSLSKRSHMTGFRAGALISKNKEIMKKLFLMRSPMGIGTPDFIQDAATASWNDDKHPAIFSEEYAEKQALLRSALESKGFEIFGGEATFYLWFNHPQYKTSDALMQLFLSQHLVLSPGSAFGSDGEGYVRLVYCCTLDQCREISRRIEALEI